MQVIGLPSGFGRLSKYGTQHSEQLSPKARDRFHALSQLRRHGDVQGVMQEYGVTRATVYRWRKRFNPRDWSSLEDRSRRPHRLRQWLGQMEEAVLELRQMFPRWSKVKLADLLQQRGLRTSASTVGRILKKLKDHRRLVEPSRRGISAKRRRLPRPYATRKPRDYQPQRPGQLVQIDTLDVRPLSGVLLKQLTARDVVSRWDVLDVHSRATSALAAKFLDTLKDQAPFPIEAVQVDGGSEFFGDFERSCQQ